MQEAIPYRSGRQWSLPPASNAARRRTATLVDGSSTSSPSPSPSTSSSSSSSSSSYGVGGGSVMRMTVAENPVVVVGPRGCCMCDVARRLLLGLGVNPAVCEIGDGAAAAAEAAALVEEAVEIEQAGGDQRRSVMLPVVFVGGRLLGGLDRLVTVHITGELVPILKEAGALWL
ncbi:monothiol glutaredoxin-S9-like [Canna indica]|uniref:Monothiol glutaredoxin-S9-like n=1 Tax=Canna indica TaxID=4628 RepID=A0AAQ3KNT0_9LILI|nr:monothiol glutaredoxin-S9-like [Canna indica]